MSEVFVAVYCHSRVLVIDKEQLTVDLGPT